MTLPVQSKFMVISTPAEVIAIRRIAREMASEMGFDESTREEIGLVVSELASNITKYAPRGIITLSQICDLHRKGLVIEAEDEGEGFVNIHVSMQDGVSTAGTLGVGLGAVNRLMDEFDILQREDRTGTRIICKRFLHNNTNYGKHCPFNFGVVSRQKPSETMNGDTFIIKHIRNATLVGVIDGVGHGILAAQAANAARQYIEQHADSSLFELFKGVDRACASTRGVVMALAVFDWSKNSFHFASVGNIEASIFHGHHEKPKFIVRRGIVGKHAPQPVITENKWHAGNILALHSDGISSHWSWHDFSTYTSHPAQVIAEHIYNANQKNHDDATIVIVK